MTDLMLGILLGVLLSIPIALPIGLYIRWTEQERRQQRATSRYRPTSKVVYTISAPLPGVRGPFVEGETLRTNEAPTNERTDLRLDLRLE